MIYRSSYIFFRWGGSALPHQPDGGTAPGSVFLQWHQVPIVFTNQNTKLNTNQAIPLVNNIILMWADRFLLIFLSPKTEI